MKEIRAVELIDEKLHFIDQTKLPFEEVIVISDDYERIASAIERLEIRGAPAIGVAVAYALALSLKNIPLEKRTATFEKSFQRLASTRPTAVNLFFALDEMNTVYDQYKSSSDLFGILLKKAMSIHNQDILLCDKIASNGLSLFTKKVCVLTHCNTGALATGGGGTALNVIRKAFVKGYVEYVYADETRPLLQGSRLTAWELKKYGIPFSINTDSTAAFLMQQDKIDLVIVGADRIAVNGDAANKIGTYNLAVLCKYHNIPFYIAAPTTTIDKKCLSGSEIQIEIRDKKELTHFGSLQITLDNFPVYSPAFDISPSSLITAIITEKGIHKPPFDLSHV